MKYCRYLFLGFLAIVISGCGQTVKESVKVPPAGTKSTLGGERTILVLPFADYTFADNIESAYRRQLVVSENITDQLVGHSFRLPVEEDVIKYLVEQNFINIQAYENKKSSSVAAELHGEWSDTMKNELRRYMDLANSSLNEQSVLESPGTHGLSQHAVAKIGRQFSADFIMRGRIIQYKTRQEPSWAPWKKGVLPFLFGTTSQMTFGQASSDTYDNWDDMIVGGTYGAIYGSTKSEQDILGLSDGNAILWTSLGVGLGHLSNKGGKIPQAVVQMRIWVQDGYSGDVVWTNRIDVRVSPESVLADYQYDDLFERATEKAAATMVTDFVNHGL